MCKHDMNDAAESFFDYIDYNTVFSELILLGVIFCLCNFNSALTIALQNADIFDHI